jgi:TonB family protein
MNGAARRSLLLSIFRMASFLAIAFPIVAQEPDLSGLANILADRIASRKVRSVVVADFLSPLGAESPTGKYMAAKLTESWAQHDQKFQVVERAKLEAALTQQKETAKDLGDSKTLKGLSKLLSAEAIMTGTVEVLEDRLVLYVSVRKLSNGTLVASGQQSFPRSGVIESLNQAIPPSSLDVLPRAGVNGVSAPVCDFCPQPEFPTEARVAKIHQTLVLLDIVVTPHGSAAAIRILKDPGLGFAENAIKAVRRWRFRPAVDKDKTPIAARVQIEISFHDWQ